MTDETGAQNEPADDVGAALRAALEEQESKENEQISAQTDESIGDNANASETEGHSEVSGSSETNEQGEEGDARQPGAESVHKSAEDNPEEITPPEHWAQADKDVFNGIEDPKLKQWMMGRHTAMEADYTNKRKESADFLREYEPVDKVLSPLRPLMAQRNMSTDQVIGMWAQTQQDLMYRPAEAIKQLAETYNVDLNQFAKRPEDEGFTDPQIEKLNAQINALQSTVNTQNQANQQSQVSAMQARIDEFAAQKDESGNLKHPYFNDVMDTMISQAALLKQQGLNPSLPELYESAIWANPQTREKQLTLQREQEQVRLAEEAKKRDEQKKRDLEKSKAASKSVSGDGSGSTPASNDVQAALESAFADAEGRI